MAEGFSEKVCRSSHLVIAMVLVLPWRSHLNTSSGVSRTPVPCKRFPHHSSKAASSPRQGKFYCDSICDPCTRRSSIRCQSATGVQSGVAVSALQPDTQIRASCDETQASTGVLIRPVEPSELEEVAWLRAEAYYEVHTCLLAVLCWQRCLGSEA